VRLVVTINPYTMQWERALEVLRGRLDSFRPPGESFSGRDRTIIRDWEGRVIGEAHIEGAGPWPVTKDPKPMPTADEDEP